MFLKSGQASFYKDVQETHISGEDTGLFAAGLAAEPSLLVSAK